MLHRGLENPGPCGPLDPAREAALERHLLSFVRNKGGLAVKLQGPGNEGMPDRLVVTPGGRMGFLELKRKGELPRPLQLHKMNELAARGCVVGWADDRESVERFVNVLMGNEGEV